MLKYFDAHSHLNFSQYDTDREEVIARMQKEDVWTITVGTDLKTSKEVVELAGQHEGIFATVGVHPTDWEEGFDEDTFRALVENKKVVAIGECGLDYFRDQDRKKEQKELFERHIALAHELGLPLVIHGRPSAGSMDAYEDILGVLTTHHSLLATNCPGNVHFFVGNTRIAERFLDIGFTLSFDGPITFTRDYDEVVRYVPLAMLLAETDAPFAAPEPYRGKRNEPSYVQEVVSALARIRGEDEEKVREQTVQNTLKVFRVAL